MFKNCLLETLNLGTFYTSSTMSSGKKNSDKWNLSEAFIVDLNENLLTQMLA